MLYARQTNGGFDSSEREILVGKWENMKLTFGASTKTQINLSADESRYEKFIWIAIQASQGRGSAEGDD